MSFTSFKQQIRLQPPNGPAGVRRCSRRRPWDAFQWKLPACAALPSRATLNISATVASFLRSPAPVGGLPAPNKGEPPTQLIPDKPHREKVGRCARASPLEGRRAPARSSRSFWETNEKLASAVRLGPPATPRFSHVCATRVTRRNASPYDNPSHIGAARLCDGWRGHDSVRARPHQAAGLRHPTIRARSMDGSRSSSARNFTLPPPTQARRSLRVIACSMMEYLVMDHESCDLAQSHPAMAGTNFRFL